MTPKKSTTPKRAPKPKPVEAWAIIDPDGSVFGPNALPDRSEAFEVAKANGRMFCQIQRVTISPVPARKAAKRGKEGRR